MRKMRSLRASLLLVLVPWGALAADDVGAPLAADDFPAAAFVDEADKRAFLEEVRRNLQSDAALLEQYTFTETYTEQKLDGGGAVKKTKVETYEVYPSVEPRKLYRRLVARDGRPVSEKELADQDRKHEEKMARREARRAARSEAERARREAEAQRREREVIDEVFRMDDLRVTGREMVDGRPTIVVTFAPKPGYKPVTEGGKVIQKFAGTAWIDEADRQLVRLEARLVENLGVGPIRIARLQKGASAYFARRKVNGEIWLPSEARFTGRAKVLLVFGGALDVMSRYFDYRKFSVGTEEEITSETTGSDLKSSEFEDAKKSDLTPN
jgi:hypothetical protein